jgi:hypothetical protein
MVQHQKEEEKNSAIYTPQNEMQSSSEMIPTWKKVLHNKKKILSQAQWFKSVIPDTQKAEIGRTAVLGQKFTKTPSQPTKSWR